MKYFYDCNAVGTDDGVSWTNAYPAIKTALAGPASNGNILSCGNKIAPFAAETIAATGIGGENVVMGQKFRKIEGNLSLPKRYTHKNTGWTNPGVHTPKIIFSGDFFGDCPFVNDYGTHIQGIHFDFDGASNCPYYINVDSGGATQYLTIIENCHIESDYSAMLAGGMNIPFIHSAASLQVLDSTIIMPGVVDAPFGDEIFQVDAGVNSMNTLLVENSFIYMPYGAMLATSSANGGGLIKNCVIVIAWNALTYPNAPWDFDWLDISSNVRCQGNLYLGYETNAGTITNLLNTNKMLPFNTTVADIVRDKTPRIWTPDCDNPMEAIVENGNSVKEYLDALGG